MTLWVFLYRVVCTTVSLDILRVVRAPKTPHLRTAIFQIVGRNPDQLVGTAINPKSLRSPEAAQKHFLKIGSDVQDKTVQSNGPPKRIIEGMPTPRWNLPGTQALASHKQTVEVSGRLTLSLRATSIRSPSWLRQWR